MGERSTFILSGEKGFPGSSPSDAHALARRFRFFKRIVGYLSAAADRSTVAGACVTPVAGHDRLDAGPDEGGLPRRFAAIGNAGISSLDGLAPSPHSLQRTAQRLHNLLTQRQGHLDACDLLHVLDLHSSLEMQPERELDRFHGLPAGVRCQDDRSSAAAALVAVLLEIYCAALCRPPREWRGDAQAVVALRAAESARILAMFSWGRAEEPPPIVWQALAAACGKTRRRIPNPEETGVPQDGVSAADIVDATIFRLVLLALADPLSMPPGQIIAADRLIARCLRNISFRDLQSPVKAILELDPAAPRPWGALRIAAASGGGLRISVSQAMAEVLAQLGCRRVLNGTPDFPPGTPDLPLMLARRWLGAG